MQHAGEVLAIIVYIIFVIFLAIAILRFKEYWSRRTSLTPEQLGQICADAERDHRERLMNPKWKELEAHFGFAMPRSLRSLYSDQRLLSRTCFYLAKPDSDDDEEGEFIRCFEPADMQTLNDLWLSIDDNCLPFACDDFGNYFYVELTGDAEDAPVFFIDHDGGGVAPVSDSLAAFLEWRTYTDEEEE